ncbi:hypothetical protein PAPYR_11683 [Paratrimastix pyriformis]|uniref:Uncharacterized protein n=1 Tax=Paratrimastix pyriformis TaxID=342808 RepID=A0ABQ8U7D9_9EUKA|nr:hypothetical protein PAPYR_11683 [Paratrimastix pyriformis]
MRGVRPVEGRTPHGGCRVREDSVPSGPLKPPLSLTRLAPPGAGRDPLEEMFGVRMVDPESFFVVFIETFGSCDSQLDCFTALRGTDSLPTLLCVGGWRSSAVLRACCASVHSFLVWVCLGKRLLGYPTIDIFTIDCMSAAIDCKIVS